MNAGLIILRVATLGRDARVENAVTKFWPEKSQNFRSETAVVFNGEFSFFGRGKPNFWEGITSKLASQ